MPRRHTRDQLLRLAMKRMTPAKRFHSLHADKMRRATFYRRRGQRLLRDYGEQGRRGAHEEFFWARENLREAARLRAILSALAVDSKQRSAA